MATIAEKLTAIAEAKEAIKVAIEAKGVEVANAPLSEYPAKIEAIESGGGNTPQPAIKWTGHADAEGLRAIGWDDDDIAYYQEHGVNWNEEDDDLHKVSDDNKALYGVLTYRNISTYRDRIVYLPKIDIAPKGSNISNMFIACYSLVAIPLLDTSRATNMSYMFYECYSLVSIPPLDTSSVTSMSSMFSACYSLGRALIKAIGVSIDISASKLITHTSLMYIINNAKDLTGGTTQTLTLGSTNLAKLTDDEKAIIIAKNWTLA